MEKKKYQNNYSSVTQILGILNKPSLNEWFKRTPYHQILEESNKAKEIGKSIHQVIHDYIETNQAKIDTTYPDEVTNALQSFMLFRKEYPQIILKNAEISLTSKKYKFNGTLDCLGENILFDWKSGKCGKEEKPKVYDDAKYQVSAYFYLQNENSDIKIEKAIILYLAKDKIAYNLYEMEKQEIDDCFKKVFLSCLKIWKYQHKRKE